MNTKDFGVKTESFESGGWVFTATKAPMMSTGPLDELAGTKLPFLFSRNYGPLKLPRDRLWQQFIDYDPLGDRVHLFHQCK